MATVSHNSDSTPPAYSDARNSPSSRFTASHCIEKISSSTPQLPLLLVDASSSLAPLLLCVCVAIMGKLSDEFVNEPLTAEQLQLVPKPMQRLSYHVFLKGAQAGSLLGTSVGLFTAAALPLLRKTQTSIAPLPLLQAVGRAGTLGAGITGVGSLGLMGVMLWREDFNAYRIWDRAYRLNHNVSQTRCDNFSLTGAAAAAAAGLALVAGGRLTVPQALQLSSIGMAAGILLHVVSNPKEPVETAAKKGVAAVQTTVSEAVGADSRGGSTKSR